MRRKSRANKRMVKPFSNFVVIAVTRSTMYRKRAQSKGREMNIISLLSEPSALIIQERNVTESFVSLACIYPSVIFTRT